MLVVVLAADDVGVSERDVPKGDATERGTLGNLADGALERAGQDVAVGGVGRHTDKQLGVLALVTGGNDVLPLVVVEAVVLMNRTALDQLASLVVVELDEEGVKLGLLDHLRHGEPLRGGRALRGTGDEHVLVEGAEALNHGNVWLVVKVSAIGKVGDLHVKVETVNGGAGLAELVKGTGTVPRRVVGTESLPEEVGKVAAILLRGDTVVVLLAPDATDGEQHLDSLVPAVLEVIQNGAAVVKKLGGLAILGEGGSPAVRSKANTGPARGVVLGGGGDKGQADVVRALVTAVAKFLSIVTILALCFRLAG